jgi:uncharacterized protein (TIGR02453 family)
MCDGFGGFSEAGVGFLGDLQRNNDREWFNANKAVFKTELEAPAKAFMGALVEALQPVAGMTLEGKLFRMQRDVRFSKDKTPYNAHVRIAVGPSSQVSGMVGDLPRYFFSLEPEGIALGLGVFEFTREGLATYRAAVADDAAGEKLVATAAQLVKAGYSLNEPDLKRAPSGFDADGARSEFLRRKGLSVWHEEPISPLVRRPDLLTHTLAHLSAMQPLAGWITARISGPASET